MSKQPPETTEESERNGLSKTSAETLRVLDEKFTLLKKQLNRVNDIISAEMRFKTENKFIQEIDFEGVEQTVKILEGVIASEHKINVGKVDVLSLLDAKIKEAEVLKKELASLNKEYQGEVGANGQAAMVKRNNIAERRDEHLKVLNLVGYLKEYAQKIKELNEKSVLKESAADDQSDFKNQIHFVSYATDLFDSHDAITVRALKEIDNLALCLREALEKLPKGAEITKTILGGVRGSLDSLQVEVGAIKRLVVQITAELTHPAKTISGKAAQDINTLADIFSRMKRQIESPPNAAFYNDQIEQLPALLANASTPAMMERAHDTVRKTMTQLGGAFARRPVSDLLEEDKRDQIADLRQTNLRQAVEIDALRGRLSRALTEIAGLSVEGNDVRRENEVLRDNLGISRRALGERPTVALAANPIVNDGRARTNSGQIIQQPAPLRMPAYITREDSDRPARNGFATFFINFLNSLRPKPKKPNRK